MTAESELEKRLASSFTASEGFKLFRMGNRMVFRAMPTYWFEKKRYHAFIVTANPKAEWCMEFHAEDASRSNEWWKAELARQLDGFKKFLASEKRAA
jgi:hypothetical protein